MHDPRRRMPIADFELEAALRDLGRELAVPSDADRGTWVDPAVRARARIAVGDVPRPRCRIRLVYPAGLPLRRSIALAVVAVLAVAVVAGALGLGLPGIRIVPAPSGSEVVGSATPPPGASTSPADRSPSPTISGELGAGLGLGDPIAVSNASTAVDFPIRLPTAAGIGPPASAWLLAGRLSLVWPVSGILPSTREPGVGLILSEFRGSVDRGYFEKVVGPDTNITAVSVDGVTGYWISGAPHEIVFVDVNGFPVFDSRRIVGDTLLWARGDVTYRLESGLEQAAAIALADGLR